MALKPGILVKDGKQMGYPQIGSSYTAGDHITIDDGEIAVNRYAIPAGNIVYEVLTGDYNSGNTIYVDKYKSDGTLIERVTVNPSVYQAQEVDEKIRFYKEYNRWEISLLVACKEQSAGYNYTVLPHNAVTKNDFTFTVEQQLDNNDLVIRGELATKQDTLTFDDTPTQNSTNPVKSGGVYSSLSEKQDALTAGDYIDITSGEISVNREIPPNIFTYEIVTKSTGNNDASVTVKKYANGSLVSSTDYLYTNVSTAVNIDGYLTLQYAGNWKYTLLQASTDHASGYVATWGYQTVVDYTESFPTEDTSGLKLVIKSEMDSAIDSAVSRCYHHAGTKTCAELVAGLLVAGNEGNVYNMTDSGTTTADFIEGAGQPIKAGDNVGIAKISDGVYKFDLLSGFVDTTNFVQKSETAGLLKNDGTVDTTIQGDVSSLKSGLTNLDSEVNGDATTYPYADVITIEDAVPANLADCTVKIEPVQDLHGQSAPYVGGAGKNKLPMTVAGIKALNTDGTWSGNNYTLNGVTFTVNTDDGGNVTDIKTVGTASDVANLYIDVNCENNTSYILSGCPSGGGFDTAYCLLVLNATYGYQQTDTGDGVTFSYSNAQPVRFRLRVASGYSFPTGGLTFYPMIRLATETDATFAPYTNICPITGHTEASVQRTGKNILDLTTYTSNKYLNASGVETEGTGYGISDYLNVGKSLQYSASGLGSVNGTYACFYDDSKAFISSSAESNNPFTFTTPSNARYVRVSLRNVSALTAPQVEMGATATAYEPYQKHTVTIALGDTIYGGTVRIDSNGNTVMDVDRGERVYDGSEDEQWSEYVGTNYHQYNLTISDSVDKWYMSNLLKIITVDEREVKSGIAKKTSNFDNLLRVCFLDTEYSITSLADFKTWLASNPLQVCYELATPTTIQLTPTQIQLLKGTNTLTASTGQISVTVNGVSGAIGAVQEQVNEIETRLETTESNITTLQSGVVKKTLIFSGISSKVITFSGKIHCRNVAMFLVCGGQTGVGNPISIMFTGESTGVQTMTSVQVATNSDGVTASGLSITIPAELYGEWGNHTLIELFPDDNYTYTVTDAT